MITRIAGPVAAALLATFLMEPALAAPKDPGTATLEEQVAALTKLAQKAQDRAEVANLFGRYMYLHNAFEDPEIISLWVKKGTPDVRAQYSNAGVYTDWDKIMAYHAQRPHQKGKLVMHNISTPVIEIAEDGQTAKGAWIMNGVESGLTDPEAAKLAPDFMYTSQFVDGKRVWMHDNYVKYGIDFLKQDGQWKIWHLHCYEVARSPYGLGWIPFAAKSQNSPFKEDIMYFGEDGKPVLMATPDSPVTLKHNPYRTDTVQNLDLQPPVPYRTFSETFAY